MTDQMISVGFRRWCVSIEGIVLLDFIHRLVSQKTNKQTNTKRDQFNVSNANKKLL
jgi:hypothetical protein